MKKTITILVMLLISFIAIGQTTQRNTLYSSKGFKFAETITNEVSNKYFVYTFKNEKYKHITDMGIIILNNKQLTEDFANKLIELSDTTKGTGLSFKANDYVINLYESVEGVFIYDNKDKYFSLSKTDAKLIAEEILNNINLLN